jgi:hypothetical protein
LFISSAFAVQQVRGHKGVQVNFKLGGENKNLDNAFNNQGQYKLNFYDISLAENLVYGHNPSEIFVNVNGAVKNFSTALSDGSLRDTPANKSPASYTPISFGETANNILVNVGGSEKSLQDAINEGAFFAGCYDGANVRLNGSTWQVPYQQGYECECSKSGCKTCYRTAYATKKCVNRVIS